MSRQDATMRAKEAMAEIDRRKAHLDRIREILATLSLEDIALLSELLNGNGRSSHKSVRMIKGKTPLAGGSERGTLVEAVQRVIENHDVITSTAVLSDLNKERFNFANENPIAGVSAVLRKLHGRGQLIMTRKGKGAIATEFRKAGSHSQRARASA